MSHQVSSGSVFPVSILPIAVKGKLLEKVQEKILYLTNSTIFVVFFLQNFLIINQTREQAHQKNTIY